MLNQGSQYMLSFRSIPVAIRRTCNRGRQNGKPAPSALTISSAKVKNVGANNHSPLQYFFLAIRTTSFPAFLLAFHHVNAEPQPLVRQQ